MSGRPGVVTDRCRALKNGDGEGHAARGERRCEVCNAKGSARYKHHRLRSGRTVKVSKADLLVFVREFNRAWDALDHDPDRVFHHAAEAMFSAQ